MLSAFMGKKITAVQKPIRLHIEEMTVWCRLSRVECWKVLWADRWAVERVHQLRWYKRGSAMPSGARGPTLPSRACLSGLFPTSVTSLSIRSVPHFHHELVYQVCSPLLSRACLSGLFHTFVTSLSVPHFCHELVYQVCSTLPSPACLSGLFHTSVTSLSIRFVSDIAIFVLKRDVKLQLAN